MSEMMYCVSTNRQLIPGQETGLTGADGYDQFKLLNNVQLQSFTLTLGLNLVLCLCKWPEPYADRPEKRRGTHSMPEVQPTLC